MKRTIMAAAVAAFLSTAPVMCLATSPVQISNSGNNMITVKTDKKTIDITADSTATGGVFTSIIVNGDTVVSADMNKLLMGRLNDTVLSSARNSASANYNNEDYDDNEDYMIAMVTIVGFWGIILVVSITGLIIYYLNRRNRLRTIERAIENNYQLPDSFYSNKSRPLIYGSGPDLSHQQPDKTQEVLRYANEREVRHGFKLAIVGLGLILFFGLLGIYALAALSVIPLMLGVYKILIIPYLRRNSDNSRVPQAPPQSKETPEPPTFTHGTESQPKEEN